MITVHSLFFDTFRTKTVLPFKQYIYLLQEKIDIAKLSRGLGSMNRFNLQRVSCLEIEVGPSIKNETSDRLLEHLVGTAGVRKSLSLLFQNRKWSILSGLGPGEIACNVDLHKLKNSNRKKDFCIIDGKWKWGKTESVPTLVSAEKKRIHILEVTEKMKDRSNHRINLTIAKYDWIVFWFFVSFNLVGLFMFSVSGIERHLQVYVWLDLSLPKSHLKSLFNLTVCCRLRFSSRSTMSCLDQLCWVQEYNDCNFPC